MWVFLAFALLVWLLVAAFYIYSCILYPFMAWSFDGEKITGQHVVVLCLFLSVCFVLCAFLRSGKKGKKEGKDAGRNKTEWEKDIIQVIKKRTSYQHSWPAALARMSCFDQLSWPRWVLFWPAVVAKMSATSLSSCSGQDECCFDQLSWPRWVLLCPAVLAKMSATLSSCFGQDECCFDQLF